MTGEDVLAIRTRLVCGSFNWADWSEEERLEFAMAKLWPESMSKKLEREKEKEAASKDQAADKAPTPPAAVNKKKKKRGAQKETEVNNGYMLNPPLVDEEFTKLLNN